MSGQRFSNWKALSSQQPRSVADLVSIVRGNRDFAEVHTLQYGDYGLEAVIDTVCRAIRNNHRIALYADYDVDGTMSAVSWIWFLRGIGYENYTHYIPCRFSEGYGVNLKAMQHLIEQEHAQLIITMDTGITANAEAAYCRAQGVGFICTDHHKIQPDKMPDCLILNPKMHPDPMYQELCGCGITFVLLRKLAEHFPVSESLWTDILALAGMATICDVVPLNGVNHRLAKLGVQALMRSKRPVLAKLRSAAAIESSGDESDVGFRIGPRINAVGRLDHADAVVDAFVREDPEQLICYMSECNDKRKLIQQKIWNEAQLQAKDYGNDPILFLGGDWHPGVVGIAASKIAESFWRPTWLFQRDQETGMCKGSARSIEGFDVTDAMCAAKDLFAKYGGHRAAGGFSFKIEHEAAIRTALLQYAEEVRQQKPELWQSSATYDTELPLALLDLSVADALADLKPFGHAFSEPRFRIRAKIDNIRYFNDKQTGLPKHSAIFLRGPSAQKVMFFNEVVPQQGTDIDLLVTASKQTFRGVTKLELYGVDYAFN